MSRTLAISVGGALGKEETKQLSNLFSELDAPARKVALSACRAYKRCSDIRSQMRVRNEFKQFLKNLKRVGRALKCLETGLSRLDAHTRSSFGGRRLVFLCDLIREAHMLEGPVLLPIPGESKLPRDYFKRMHIADPAEPFEVFFKTHKATVHYTAKEIRFLQNRLDSTRLGRMTRRGTFSRGGGLQYALTRLFEDRAKPRLRPTRIEERISQVLNLLDKGGPSINPESRRGCDAVRKAIKRLSDAHKLQCDRYLNYHLNLSSN